MSNQLQITGGAKVRNLEGVITGTSGVLGSVPLGAANGVATLDSGGKVPVSQLPASVVTYLGTWNAATNTPTLTNGVGDAGDLYICNVAGTANFGAGPVTFAVGDWVLYGSGTWQKSSGQNGTVTSVAASINGNAIGLTGSPITTAGTLAFAFAGTSGQYVNGAGNLTTFPTLITSIGLSMPSAFSVANSPLTANGTIAVTGAGSSAQYIDGTGALQTFPTIITEAQNLICDVYNQTGATLTKGTIVYINGGHGNLPSVTKSQANNETNSSQTFGIVQVDITNMNNGHVVIIGTLDNLDTSAYSDGTILYLSPTVAGAWTDVKPSAPNHMVYVGTVVRAHPTQGVVEVRIQNGYELQELHNVAITSPANGNILQYDSATFLWKNVAGTTTNIAEGTNLYYTDARVRAALSAGVGISYNNTTGVISSTITQYTDALARAAISLTTTGTSGASTYNSTTGVLNIPNYAPDLSGYVPYTGATTNVNLGAYQLTATNLIANGSTGTSGMLHLKNDASQVPKGNGYTSIGASSTSILVQSYTGVSTYKSYLLNASLLTDGLNRIYNLPDASGTIALTSQLSGYLPLTGGTLTGALNIGTTSNYATLKITQQNNVDAFIITDGYNSNLNFQSYFNSTLGNLIYSNDFTNTGYIPLTAYTSKFSLPVGSLVVGGSNDNGYAFYINGNTKSTGSIESTSFIKTSGTSSQYLMADGSVSTLSNPVTGTGTTNYHAKFTGTGTIGNSLVYDDGTNIGISTTTIGSKFQVNGNAAIGYSASTAAPTNGLLVAGKMGINATVASWASEFSALQIGARTAIWNSDINYSGYGNNVYYDGVGYKYITTAAANKLEYGGGIFTWSGAASGTAATAITFTDYMRLDASGNLGIGTTTIGSKLQVNGNAAIGYSASTAAPTNGLAVSGNVGIGTNSANELLSLAASTSTTFGISFLPSGWNGAKFRYSVPTSGNAAILSYNWNGSARDYTGYGTSVIGLTDAQITFGVGNAANPTTAMTISPSGNVLIGTTTDNGAKLQVNGAATFSSSVTAGGEIGISGNASIALNNLSGTFSQQLQYRNNGTTKFQLYLDASNNSFNIFNSALSTNSFTIKSTGIVNIAKVPTSTSGLATGDIYKTVAGVLMIM